MGEMKHQPNVKHVGWWFEEKFPIRLSCLQGRLTYPFSV